MDDIWSEPIVESVTTITEPNNNDGLRPSKRARPALFLSDSEDEDASNGRRVSPGAASPSRDNDALSAPGAAQLDAMFSGLDDDDDPFTLAPALDVEKMKRQADARLAATSAPKSTLPSMTPYALGESSPVQDKDKKDEKGKKTKRTLPKLDEERPVIYLSFPPSWLTSIDRLLGPDGFPRLTKEYKSFKVTGKGQEV
jgi:replication fork protection complex subunit Csm3/Swi3